MEIKRIPLSKIERNTGQIEGVPTNPRQWSEDDVNKIAKSLEETPELFEARPLLLYPVGNKFVILGGNLRFTGAKKLKWKTAPAIIVPEETSVEKLREVVIKDNGSFGEWDFDALANEWDDLPLAEWGVPAWDTKEESTEQSEDTEEAVKVTISFPSEEQRERFLAVYKTEIEEAYDCKMK